MGNSQSTIDVEEVKPTAEQDRGGYERLGALQGDVPDLAIYRRFSHLSAQVILHHQAELYDLEAKLRKIQRKDREAGDERGRYFKSSTKLRASVRRSDEEASDDGEEDDDSSLQWMTMQRISIVLEKYYSALNLHHQMVNLKSPQRAKVDALHDWMRRTDMGNIFLVGKDSLTWDLQGLKESELKFGLEELLTLESETLEGTTSSQHTERLVKWYHQSIGKHLHEPEDKDHTKNSIVYRQSGVLTVIRTIKAFVASMLPVVSIAVLYSIEDMDTRIGLATFFTAVFSLLICHLTSASIKDVFSATAAFSAVLVVFIGTADVGKNEN